MKRKVFILGCHKSGTSLLRSLLDGHKELFVIPIEAHIFENLGSWIDYYYRNQSPKILNNSGLKNNFIKRIKKANKPSSKYSAGDTSGKWDIELFKKYFHINQKTKLKKIINSYFNSIHHSLYNSSIKKKIVVEKSVENAEFAPILSQIFPNAKFIRILRNPYSNIVSFRKYKNKKNFPYLKSIIYTLYNSYYNLYKNNLFFDDTHYKIIKYENLVSKPKEVLSNISKFINIKYDDVLLKPSILNKSWYGNSITDKKFNKISTKRLSEWQEEISHLETLLINKLFTYILNKFDYKKKKTDKKYYYPIKGEKLKSYFLNRLLYKYFLPS